MKLGFLKESEYFLAEKAVYGLRRSPRCWGAFRDGVLVKMKTKGGLRFEPCYADSNLWQILDGDSKVGLLMVYVDDLDLVASSARPRCGRMNPGRVGNFEGQGGFQDEVPGT